VSDTSSYAVRRSASGDLQTIGKRILPLTRSRLAVPYAAYFYF